MCKSALFAQKVGTLSGIDGNHLFALILFFDLDSVARTKIHKSRNPTPKCHPPANNIERAERIVCANCLWVFFEEVVSFPQIREFLRCQDSRARERERERSESLGALRSAHVSTSGGAMQHGSRLSSTCPVKEVRGRML